jgi:hypothetical protein
MAIIMRLRLGISLSLIVVNSLLLTSCKYFEKKATLPNAVAKVFDTYLYVSDLEGVVPKGSSAADSNSIVKKYIQHWTEEQILLHQAQNNLGEKQLELNKQIEDYKNSLIIYAYEKEVVRQKLDTIVSDSDVQHYYDENKKDFQLKNDIVKIIYVKVSNKAPDMDKLKEWITSTDADDREKLSKYCYQFGQNFFLDDQVWFMFDDVLKEVPIQTYNQDLFLQNNRFVQIADSSSTYFLNIKGYMIKNSTSPISFEKDNIKKILINKRKMDLIEQMKKNLYEQAELHNNITFY